MPKIVDKAAKREEIAKHAMALFAKAGFENTPIREITSQAGMGKGTFYDYFTDKTDILNEIVRIMFTEWMKFMISKISHIDDPLEQLRVLLKEGAMLGESFEQFMIIYVDMWRRSVSSKESSELVEKFRGFLSESKQAVIQIVESAKEKGSIRQEVDAAAMATIILALIDGLCLHQMILKPDENAGAISDHFFKSWLTGIQPEN
jgi:TetR/AcrR family transcriptional repressor of nem operon